MTYFAQHQRWYYVSEGMLIVFLAAALMVHVWADLAPVVRSTLLVSVALVGITPVLWSVYRAIRMREITVDLLAGLALVFALIGKEWSSAVFVSLMLSAARILNHWNDARTEQNLAGLLHLRPERARVKRHGTIREILATDITVGDRVLCEVGSRVPIDGRVIAGEAAVDEASLTGESVPVEKGVGSMALSSTLVVSGNLEIEAIRVGRDTTLERMIALVELARHDKPAISTMAERFGKFYILSIFLLAMVLWGWTQDLKLILAVALVVCADDVAIAIPLAYVSAIGNAAKRGIIIKGGRYLEAIGQATTFVFDKTGTITSGILTVKHVKLLSAFPENRLQAYLQRLGERSQHPVAKAIVQMTQGVQGLEISADTLTDFRELSGKGLSGTFGMDHVLVGRQSLMRDQCVTLPPEVGQQIQMYEQRGESVVCVAVNGEIRALVSVGDEIRPGVQETLETLRRLGVRKIVMLTGDNEAVAARVAQAVGIEEYYAGLLPEQKLATIETLTRDGGVSVMVGDGVNDAAALERATVGVAMGAIGYAAAIESANIVLMHDDIRRLPELAELSHSLKGIVKQNFWLWGISNVVGLGLVFAGVIGPVGAAVYNFLTDFVPLINSLKVVRIWFERPK